MQTKQIRTNEEIIQRTWAELDIVRLNLRKTYRNALIRDIITDLNTITGLKDCIDEVDRITQELYQSFTAAEE